MKKILFGFLLLSFVHCKSQLNAIELEKEALGIFDAFQKQLLSSLTKSLLDKGPVAAISHCSLVSPQLESQYSKGTWKIRRVSNKPRNPNHALDAWESEVFQTWLADPASIKPTNQISGSTFRIMKPISIANPTCLQCHGNSTDMNPEILKEIQKIYPEDKALGYKMGDLRGAFSAEFSQQ